MRIKRVYLVLAVIALPVLFFLQNPKLYEPIHDITNTFLKPAAEVTHFLSRSATRTIDAIRRFWQAFYRQGYLEEEIRTLRGSLVEYEETNRENQRLKKLLDFKQTQAKEALAAKVIGRDLSLWRKTLLLDKGSVDGIKKEMTVLTPRGLVGRVIEVNPITSRVLMLIDPDSRVSALSSQTRNHGVVAGDGTSQLLMVYLDLDSDINVGETVLTSGVGSLYQKGKGIGVIEKIGRSSDALHLEAAVKPFVEFNKIEEVLCLVSSTEK